MGKRSTLITIVMEPNAPLSYATGTKHQHPIMSMLGSPGVLLEIDIYIYIESITMVTQAITFMINPCKLLFYHGKINVEN